MASKNYYSSSSNCSVGASDIAGRGTFATRHIGAGVELFRETAFLVSRGGNGPRAVRKRDSIIAGAPSRCQHAKISVDASPKQMCASLSAISIQHKHCPPSVRLAPADTGGTLSGSEDTYWFAKAYAACSSVTRAAVQELDTFGGDESHAVFEVVRAESVVLRQFDPDLRLLPTDELERAIQRQVVAINIRKRTDCSVMNRRQRLCLLTVHTQYYCKLLVCFSKNTTLF